MGTTALDTKPFWSTSGTISPFPRLTRNLTTDVVVVGGGVTGLTAAYELARAGRRVVLLERERCASIDTGHTSSHLTMVTDTPLASWRSTLDRRTRRPPGMPGWRR